MTRACFSEISTASWASASSEASAVDGRPAADSAPGVAGGCGVAGPARVGVRDRSRTSSRQLSVGLGTMAPVESRNATDVSEPFSRNMLPVATDETLRQDSRRATNGRQTRQTLAQNFAALDAASAFALSASVCVFSIPSSI